MAGMNGIVLNDNLQMFKEFAVHAKEWEQLGGKTVAMSSVDKVAGLGKFTVSKSNVMLRGEHDRIHFWGRTPEMKAANNNTRRDFFNAVVAQFGGDPRDIPANVKEAMLLKDFGLKEDALGATDSAFKTGKPLSARRIDAVLKEIEKTLSRERGSAAFTSFYEEMTASTDGGNGIVERFEVHFEDALRTMLAARFKEVDAGLEVGMRKEIQRTATAMAALMGESPNEFKLHEDMEPMLETLCDKICSYFDSKDVKALVRTSFNFFIDSMKTERKLDEKIAAAFSNKGRNVDSGSRELANLKMKLASLKAAENPNQEEILNLSTQIDRKRVKQRTALDSALKELLNDQEFTALAAKKNHGLRTRDNLAGAGKFDRVNKQACSLGTDTFMMRKGASTEAVTEFLMSNPDKPVCIHVYGDATFPFCGLLSHWTTQEEANVRDADVKTWAGLIGQGLIKPSETTHDRFEFATDKMDSMRGFTVKTHIMFSDLAKNAKPVKVTFLFSSMPSMATNPSSNLDAKGDYGFLMDCKNLYSQTWPVKESDHPRAEKFIAALHQELKKQKCSGNQCQMVLKLLKFSGPNAHFNVFGKDTKTEVVKLIEFVKNNYNSEKSELIREIEEKADENYQAVCRKHIREWIIEARETGSKILFGGPIGCGAFGNDSKLVSKLIAEEFKENGGEMQFCYDLFSGKEDDTMYQDFKEAFAAVGLADKIEAR